jgi:hypothetical protein
LDARLSQATEKSFDNVKSENLIVLALENFIFFNENDEKYYDSCLIGIRKHGNRFLSFHFVNCRKNFKSFLFRLIILQMEMSLKKQFIAKQICLNVF